MSSRKPRFRRSKEIPSIQVTARDAEILRRVSHHRFLNSRQILSLVGGSAQQLLRRLQLLFHHGYLDRPRSQIDYYHKGGSQVLVYGIGNRGIAVLEERFSIPRRKVDWTTKNRSASRLFLQHTLFVADVMISFELACRKNPEIRLIDRDDADNEPLR